MVPMSIDKAVGSLKELTGILADALVRMVFLAEWTALNKNVTLPHGGVTQGEE